MVKTVLAKLDKTIQEKFNGDYGAAIYDEALQLVFMNVIHHRLKEHVDPRHHEEIDKHWYGSWSSNHPLHRTRTTLSGGIGWVADQTYSPKHNPVATLCDAIGKALHSKVVEWAKPDVRDHDHDDHLKYKINWISSKVETIDQHIQAHLD